MHGGRCVTRLVGGQDNSKELEELQAAAEKALSDARAEAQKVISEAKSAAQTESNAKLAAAKEVRQLADHRG